MPQISASIKPELIESIKKIQEKEKVEISFSQMVEILLTEAVTKREKSTK